MSDKISGFSTPVKDQIFQEKIEKIADFKFGTAVANVFDDMVNRSVPYYSEIQRMIAELAADQAQPGTNVYDLGCSTGTTMIGMNTLVNNDIQFIGIDDSAEMLAKCDEKLKAAGLTRKYQLITADLHSELSITNASVVTLCLTLQFIRPLYREKLIQKISEGLNPGGVLILVEKVLGETNDMNRNFIKYYYDYKRRNHYTEMEIAQKREALENVLIPYKLSENIQMLQNNGFNHCETFFKWYNFAGIIAIKK